MDIREDRKFRALLDMPIGFGEPHYAQLIRTEKIKAWDAYPGGRQDRLDAITNDYHRRNGPRR